MPLKKVGVTHESLKKVGVYLRVHATEKRSKLSTNDGSLLQVMHVKAEKHQHYYSPSLEQQLFPELVSNII
jgi:hypothetical protein